MNVVEEIERYKREIQRIGEKIAQAMRIRTRLVIQRSEAIRKYATLNRFASLKGETEKYVVTLQRCFKNEKKFVSILDENLDKGITILKRTKLLMKKLKAKKEVIQSIKNLLWFLRYAQNKLEKIKSRMAKEEEFLRTQNIGDFNAFEKAWSKEIKYDKIIAKKLNPRRISKTKDYVNKLTKVLETGSTAALPGMVGGAFFGMFQTALFGAISGWNERMGMQMVVFWSAFITICTIVTSISKAISEHEQKLFEIQQPVLLKIKDIS